MPGKSKAVHSGNELRDAVADIGRSLGLDVNIEAGMGRRIWVAPKIHGELLKLETESG